VILQLVCPELGHQADAAALLLLVEKDSRAFCGDALEGKLKLEAAVAAERAEDVASEALRVYADHGSGGGRSRMDVAHDHSDELFGLAGLRV
jgi:hypothetical protein